MIVAFCGHRQMEDAMVRPWLKGVIEELILEGAAEFWSGDKGEFSRCAAQMAAMCRKEHPHVRVVLVQAYLNQPMDSLIFDESLYPPLEKVPRRLAMVYRDRYMVDRADVLVSYAVHDWGNSAAIRDRALKKGKRVICYPHEL